MLRPKKMKKIRLIVIKSAVEKLIKDLHEAGVVQITSTKYDGLEDGRPLGSFDSVSAPLTKLRGILTIFEQFTKTKTNPQFMESNKAVEETNDFFAQTDPQIKLLTHDINSFGDQIKDLEGKGTILKRLLPFGSIDFSKLNTKRLTYRIGDISASNRVTLQKKLSSMQNTTLLSPSAENKLSLIIFDRKDESGIDGLLTSTGFVPIDLPPGTTIPSQFYEQLQNQRKQLQNSFASARSELKVLADANIDKVRSLIHSFEVESERASISTRFSSSRYLYVIQGWILATDMLKVEHLAGKYGSSVIFESVEFDHHKEMPPTVFDNPKIIEPFEFITKGYSFSNYFEIDPTLPYFICLPIIYGMIVGDVLYGITSMLLAFAILNKFKKSYLMRNVSAIWFISGIPTIIFGIIFD
ncbi:hypothetical protein HZC07_04925 [Candidatus Micrarchaeota archaeon]|nr:hypothetical protein [Candidatus Micrarchaeota archaeon]